MGVGGCVCGVWFLEEVEWGGGGPVVIFSQATKINPLIT